VINVCNRKYLIKTNLGKSIYFKLTAQWKKYAQAHTICANPSALRTTNRLKRHNITIRHDQKKDDGWFRSDPRGWVVPIGFLVHLVDHAAIIAPYQTSPQPLLILASGRFRGCQLGFQLLTGHRASGNRLVHALHAFPNRRTARLLPHGYNLRRMIKVHPRSSLPGATGGGT